MAALRFPELEPGHLRDLMVDLHDLHARAGHPSVRVIASELSDDLGVSHATVYQLFTRPELPNLRVLLAVTAYLGALDSRNGRNTGGADRIDTRWQEAKDELAIQAGQAHGMPSPADSEPTGAPTLFARPRRSSQSLRRWQGPKWQAVGGVPDPERVDDDRALGQEEVQGYSGQGYYLEEYHFGEAGDTHDFSQQTELVELRS